MQKKKVHLRKKCLWTLINIGKAMPSFVMAFPYRSTCESDGCPAGREMSRGWKHMPQKRVENDPAVICSLDCDGACFLSSPSQRETMEGRTANNREHLCFSDGELRCRGRGYSDLGLCISTCF